MPLGTITGATVVTTPNYIQITGVGDFTKINVQKGDDGESAAVKSFASFSCRPIDPVPLPQAVSWTTLVLPV